MNEIARHSNTFVITADTGGASTNDKIPMKLFAGAAIIIGNTAGATQISWRGAAGQNDTPAQIYADGAQLTTAVTVGIHAIPDAAFAVPFVVPVLVSDGSTAMTLTVCAKG